MKVTVNAFFAAICLGCAVNAHLLAQPENLRFEQLTIEHGLSNNFVSKILQDRRGYVWFGTANGLNKFDGYTFTTYKRKPGDSTSLPNSGIGQMLVDQEGTLWIGYGGNGICKFDYDTETFTCYKNSIKQYAGAISLNEDQEGSLWIGARDGLYRFDKSTGTFSSENFVPQLVPAADSSLVSNVINAIYKDKKGTLWLGSHYGLHQMHLQPGGKDQPSQVSFTHYRHDPANPNSLSDNVVIDILEDHKGVLWLSNENGLNAFNPATATFSQYYYYPLNATNLSGDLAEDLQGHLWLGTDSGLVRLNKERTEIVEFRNIPEDPYSINNNHIISILADRSGTIWVGTLTQGINKASIYQKPFQHYQLHPFLPQSLSSNLVGSMTEDKTGTVWVGTFGGGLNRFDKQTQTFTHYRHDPEDPRSLGDDNVSKILEDREGNLWIATLYGNKPFSRLDPGTGTFESYSEGVYQKLGEHGIFTLYEDKEGVLWLGTMWGVKSWDRKTGKIMHYTHDPPDGLSDSWVKTIIEDHQGNLWMGTDKSLYRLNRKTGRFTQYKHDSNDDQSIISDEIKCIFQDSQNNLWIGTKGIGLCRFDYATESFEEFTQKRGLPDYTVYSILEDDAGNLWLGTDKGLSCFSLTRQTFTNYDASDGLQSNQFAIFYEIGAHGKGSDGTLYFGGINGFNAFDPAKIQPNPYVPPVVITQFKLFDKVMPGSHEAKEIHLAYEENFFSFEFASLNFMNAQKNQYSYRLQNFDSDWVDSGTRRYASYTNLDPGRYIFQVKASNNDGLWNEQGASMTIIIHPPWWQTWWAYTLYGLLALCILWTVRYYEIKRVKLRQRAAYLTELDSVKTRFFANISHEFRTPLTLILGPLKDMYDDTFKGDRKAVFGVMIRNGQRLLNLINQLLDISKLEAGKMQLQATYTDLVALLRHIAAAYESIAADKKIKYFFYPEMPELMLYADQEKIEKIVHNLLSNAFKFTPEKGEVILYLKSEEKQWALISVKDTGTGIPAEELDKVFDRFYQVDSSQIRAHEGSGLGMALAKELTELHHGHITVDSKEGKGTTFTVWLPLGKAHLSKKEIRDHVKVELPERVALDQLTDREVVEEKTIPVDANSNNPLLLVVEDNTDMRHYILNILEAHYQVREAKNGQEGIVMARELLPDLIISDVMMPEMDGYQLCQQLKTDELTSHIPIILLTAKADQKSKLSGLEIGADDYLYKPFDGDELRLIVRNRIAERQKMREHYSRQMILEPQSVLVASVDQQFLQRVVQIVEDHMADTSFGIDVFTREVGMSRAQLFRKLKALTDYTPGDFIRVRRLHRAAELLRQGAGNIAEVAFQTGFQDPSYFTKCFQKQFKQTPSEFLAARSV